MTRLEFWFEIWKSKELNKCTNDRSYWSYSQLNVMCNKTFQISHFTKICSKNHGTESRPTYFGRHNLLVKTRNSLTYNSWWHSSKMLLFLSKNRVRSCCKVFEWPSLRAASAVLWLFSNPLEQMLQKCLATNTIIPKRPTRIHKRIMRQSSTLSVNQITLPRLSSFKAWSLQVRPLSWVDFVFN